jgi:metal-sulfur cluster biosynthetic enzyme
MSFPSLLRRNRTAAPPEPRAVAAPEGAPDAAAPTEERVLDALRAVDDPEIGINVVDLGLVYGVAIAGNSLAVRLTMTTPSCPLGDHIVGEAEQALRRAFPELARVAVELVFEPPWGPERISEAARRQLGWR